MTLTELRYIVTLAQEQHFGRAAERCCVSQPTLSIGVKKLEDELGVQLFERGRASVHLTPAGADIIAQAERVLEQVQFIRDLALAGRDQLGAPLKVGAIYTVSPYLFPHLIPQLHHSAPQMPLYIEENFTHVLREKLRSGALDAIIIALPFEDKDVVTQALYEEPFFALMPADHPWTAQSSLALEQLSEQPLLLLGEGHCFRDQVLESCPFLGRPSETTDPITLESGSLETIRHMVASGLGVSVLPQNALQGPLYSSAMLAVRPFRTPAPSRTVAIAWRASFPRPKAIGVLVDAIRGCPMNMPTEAG